MTDEQKDKETARFLIVDIGSGDVLGEAASEDSAKEQAQREAQDADDERKVIGVYQKIGTARVERKVSWKGVA